MKNLVLACSLLFVFCFAQARAWQKVDCLGTYANHLQGIAIDGDKIYWSYTTKILKTDSKGNVENIIDAPWHHGDCCVHDGKLYVAVNLGKFNTKDKAKNFVYIYDADLNFEKRVPIEGLEGGLGGMEYHNGSFYLVGGIHKSEANFKVCKYSKDFKLDKTYLVPVGDSELGVQTICRAYGKFWLGCYLKKGTPRKYLWVTDDNFNILEKLSYNASCGLAPIESENANFLITKTSVVKTKHLARNRASALPIKIELKNR